MQLCVDVSIVKDIYDIPRSVLNKKQAWQELKTRLICINDKDNDYIPD